MRWELAFSIAPVWTIVISLTVSFSGLTVLLWQIGGHTILTFSAGVAPVPPPSSSTSRVAHSYVKETGPACNNSVTECRTPNNHTQPTRRYPHRGTSPGVWVHVLARRHRRCRCWRCGGRPCCTSGRRHLPSRHLGAFSSAHQLHISSTSFVHPPQPADANEHSSAV